MRILLDTNVILDYILSRPAGGEAAKKIFKLILDDEFTGGMTANTVTDIFYIIKKSLDDKKAREVLLYLLKALFVIEVDGNDCLDALKTDISDFEDALVIMCAKKDTVDYIVTNDADFQKINLPDIKNIKIISPEDLLKLYQ
jgi:Predicted nucleic acid-binding protein, contains PIN domain